MKVTSGDIARTLNVHRDKVVYAIKRLNIKPLFRAGQIRLFPESVIESIAEFLQRKSKVSRANEKEN